MLYIFNLLIFNVNSFSLSVDWEDDTWYPGKETASMLSLEEDETREVDKDYDSSNDDYMPVVVCGRFTAL